MKWKGKYKSKSEIRTGTRYKSNADRYALNKEVTKDIKKADYHPEKFGCLVPDFRCHDMEWTPGTNGIFFGKCRSCGEEVEI